MLNRVCGSDSFKSFQERELGDKWVDLLRDMKDWFSDLNTILKHKDRLRQDVFVPAALLHQEIRCSFGRYDISYGDEHSGP